MEGKKHILEPEVFDENGNRITANDVPAWNDPNDHARPKGDNGGIGGGFLTLATGMFVTVCFFIFAICILLPLALLGRIFGWKMRVFRR